MTDDEKLAKLNTLESDVWNSLDEFPSGDIDRDDIHLQAVLTIIERCQRIRANLQDKSCKLEVTCPY